MNLRSFAVSLAMAVSVAGLALPPASDAAELKKITFVQEWPVADGFWIPWILGKEKGFYADEGIDLVIVAPPTVADTMKYLGTASADVAFTTVMDIIFAKEEGAPVKAIGRYGRGNNWGIITKEGSPITVEGLKGKTVGIYNDAWTKAQLSLMLKSAKLTLDDVTMVAAADDTVPLLLQGKVDAITGITNAEGTEMVTAGKQKPEFLPAVEHGVPNTPIFMLAGNDGLARQEPGPRQGVPARHPEEHAICHRPYRRGPRRLREGVRQGLRPALYRPAVEGHDPAIRRCRSRPPGPQRRRLGGADRGGQGVGVIKDPKPVADYYTNEYLPK